jgi:hypothetical protein
MKSARKTIGSSTDAFFADNNTYVGYTVRGHALQAARCLALHELEIR